MSSQDENQLLCESAVPQTPIVGVYWCLSVSTKAVSLSLPFHLNRFGQSQGNFAEYSLMNNNECWYHSW